jgi:hypothetical protein
MQSSRVSTFCGYFTGTFCKNLVIRPPRATKFSTRASCCGARLRSATHAGGRHLAADRVLAAVVCLRLNQSCYRPPVLQYRRYASNRTVRTAVETYIVAPEGTVASTGKNIQSHNGVFALWLRQVCTPPKSGHGPILRQVGVTYCGPITVTPGADAVGFCWHKCAKKSKMMQKRKIPGPTGRIRPVFCPVNLLCNKWILEYRYSGTPRNSLNYFLRPVS